MKSNELFCRFQFPIMAYSIWSIFFEDNGNRWINVFAIMLEVV